MDPYSFRQWVEFVKAAPWAAVKQAEYEVEYYDDDEEDDDEDEEYEEAPGYYPQGGYGYYPQPAYGYGYPAGYGWPQ